MTLVVIGASAGVEIVCATRRGRALARLLPAGGTSSRAISSGVQLPFPRRPN